MNPSILIGALFTAALVLVFVVFRLSRADGRPTAGAGQGHRHKLPRDWRRWVFGEHNIPFS
jgi:hypothetical protein